MKYRHGKCTSCGAEYKIPASFQHDAAKCKECGGVVKIGPVQSAGEKAADPAPIPARKFAGKRPEDEGAAAEKKGGTLARLKAEREADTNGKGGGGTLERLKAQRSAADGPKAATAGSGGARKAGAASGAKGAKGAKGTRGGAKVGAAAQAGAAAGASRRSSARRSRSGGGDEEGGGGRARRGRGSSSRSKKEGPNMALLGGGVVALLGAGAAAFFMFGPGDDETNAAEPKDEMAVNDATMGAEDAAKSMDDMGAEAAAPAGDEGAGDDMAKDEDADEAPEEKPAPKPKKAGDPDSIDLTAISDFGPVSGGSANWASMQDDMAVWMDPDAGAKGNRARDRLVALGYEAMPVIMNGFKSLDLASDEGKSNGYVIQRALTDLAHGINFGWKSEGEKDSLYYNKRVVQMFCTQWESAQDDIDYWVKWTKLDEKDPDLAQELRGKFGGAAGGDDGLGLDDDFDDLDVD